MYLIQIFGASPLMGLALCICLATIFWCIRLTHRQNNSLDKLLAGLLGLIAIYEALRVLRDSGFAIFSGFKGLDGWVDFLIASMYLIAAMILKLSSTDRVRTKVRLRLVEANEKSMEIGKTVATLAPDLAYVLFDASPLATFALDSDNTVIYWNPAAAGLFGWEQHDTVGHPVPFDISAPLCDRHGKKVEAAVWTSPIFGANGLRRATLIIAASGAELRSAGLIMAAKPDEKPELALKA